MAKAAGEVTGQARGQISGQVIIEQLIRNVELGQFEMAYSILAPCIFSLYLHPEDYTRLTGVFSLIREDAKKALTAKLEQLNAKPIGVGAWRAAKARKPYRIACKDWIFEFFPDSEGAVPLGDIEIHSELNETSQPGYHGTKTTLLDRELTTGSARPETRQMNDRVLAEIRYEDDSGSQLFLMTQDEISIGRGGEGAVVNLALYTNDEVSRQHLRLRFDAAQNRFVIVDQSMNGTWLNGKRLARGAEVMLPAKADISVAEMITLHFEVRV